MSIDALVFGKGTRPAEERGRANNRITVYSAAGRSPTPGSTAVGINDACADDM
jgi:hypothetical protein